MYYLCLHSCSQSCKVSYPYLNINPLVKSFRVFCSVMCIYDINRLYSLFYVCVNMEAFSATVQLIRSFAHLFYVVN